MSWEHARVDLVRPPAARAASLQRAVHAAAAEVSSLTGVHDVTVVNGRVEARSDSLSSDERPELTAAVAQVLARYGVRLPVHVDDTAAALAMNAPPETWGNPLVDLPRARRRAS